jgi:hypothetical protein
VESDGAADEAVLNNGHKKPVTKFSDKKCLPCSLPDVQSTHAPDRAGHPANRSRIHERTISLRFLGIILGVLRSLWSMRFVPVFLSQKTSTGAPSGVRFCELVPGQEARGLCGLSLSSYRKILLREHHLV